MTDKKGKLSFGETIGLLSYGYKLIMQLTPMYLPLLIIKAMITAAQPMVVLLFSARILNELSGARDVRTIVTYAALTVGLTFVLSSLKAFLARETDTMGSSERAYYRTQMLQAERFAQMDFTHAEDSKISEILARMDTQARGNGLGLMNLYSYTPEIVENLFTVVFSYFVLNSGGAAGFGGSGRSMALNGVFALGIYLMFRYQAKSKRVLEKIYTENAKANTGAAYYQNYTDAGQAAKDVRIYNQSAALVKIFRDSFPIKEWLSFFFFQGRLNGFYLGFLSVVSGGVYLLTGLNALDGKASIGGVVQTAGAYTSFALALGTVAVMLGQLYNNGSFIKPLRDFMTLPDALVKGTKPVPPPSKRGYELEFRNVSFKYPSTEEYALKNLNLKLNAGQRMAVVGLNGSGKTTMIKLLCRLYDPTEGEILLDSVNIKEYDYDQYTALFSVVFQDYTLFPLWLGENVAVGGGYEAERVTKCLDGAGFSERLSKMPEGLNTVLYKEFAEDGTQVSGGEAQKIALARALYKDAPMVILDEPTAALDPIAEYEVYTTFDKTIGGKTAVFISHRLSSCRFCHDISVFDGGRLVQRGAHEPLLEDKNGLYYKLWNAQAQHYTDVETE